MMTAVTPVLETASAPAGVALPMTGDRDGEFATLLSAMIAVPQPERALQEASMVAQAVVVTPTAIVPAKATALPAAVLEPAEGETALGNEASVAKSSSVPKGANRTSVHNDTSVSARPDLIVDDPVIARQDIPGPDDTVEQKVADGGFEIHDWAPSTLSVPDVASANGAAHHGKLLVADRAIVASERQRPDIGLASQAYVGLERVDVLARSDPDTPALSFAHAIDAPSAATSPAINRPALLLPDRLATFAPLITDAVRDLVHLAQDSGLRFNVRPEMLGPVAVTIERSDTGPTLRLGVESQASAQAVRQAEPMLHDSRGQAPFVQITVDLAAPDQRGRAPRAPILARRRLDDALPAIEQRITAVDPGRYA